MSNLDSSIPHDNKWKSGFAQQQHIHNCAQRRKDYEDNPQSCLHCHGPIAFEQRKRAKFCSRSCAATYNNQRFPKRTVLRPCKGCHKSLKGAATTCRKCRSEQRYQTWRKEGLISNIIPSWLRTRILNDRGHCCEQCGWNQVHTITQICPVTIHHLDGNPTNHHPTNLVILCPNCHALTPTYGGLNRGKGRKNRYR